MNVLTLTTSVSYETVDRPTADKKRVISEYLTVVNILLEGELVFRYADARPVRRAIGSAEADAVAEFAKRLRSLLGSDEW